MSARSVVDYLLAFVGWFLLAFGPTTFVVDLVSAPGAVTTAIDVAAASLVAGPLAVWYVHTGRPVGTLGTFFFWTVGCSLAFGVLALVLLGALGVAPRTGTTTSRLLRGAFFVVVYVVAYGLAFHRERFTVGARTAETTLWDDN